MTFPRGAWVWAFYQFAHIVNSCQHDGGTKTFEPFGLSSYIKGQTAWSLTSFGPLPELTLAISTSNLQMQADPKGSSNFAFSPASVHRPRQRSLQLISGILGTSLQIISKRTQASPMSAQMLTNPSCPALYNPINHKPFTLRGQPYSQCVAFSSLGKGTKLLFTF